IASARDARRGLVLVALMASSVRVFHSRTALADGTVRSSSRSTWSQRRFNSRMVKTPSVRDRMERNTNHGAQTERRGGAGPVGGLLGGKDPTGCHVCCLLVYALRVPVLALFSLLLFRLQLGHEPLKVLPITEGVEVLVLFHVGGVLVTFGDRLPQQF